MKLVMLRLERNLLKNISLCGIGPRVWCGTVRDQFKGAFSPSWTHDIIVTNVICRGSSSVDIVLLSDALCVLVVVTQRSDVELVAL